MNLNALMSLKFILAHESNRDDEKAETTGMEKLNAKVGNDGVMKKSWVKQTEKIQFLAKLESEKYIKGNEKKS